MTTPPPAAPRTPEHEERYRALRTVATIIRVLAFIVAIVGGLAVVIGAVNAMSSSGGAIGAGLLILVGGFLYVAVVALFLFAYAEIIRLVIAVEDNTRTTAEGICRSRGSASVEPSAHASIVLVGAQRRRKGSSLNSGSGRR